MNAETRHRGVWHNLWKKIRELEGKEVTCRNAKDDKVVWKGIKKCDDNLFCDIRKCEIKIIVNKSFNSLIPQEYIYTDTSVDKTASKS